MPPPIDDFKKLDYSVLQRELAATKDRDLPNKIVNLPFEVYKAEMAFLFLGIMAYMRIDKQKGVLQRLAFSSTDLAASVASVSVVPYQDIVIPADNPDNLVLKAIKQDKTLDTKDWHDLLVPALTKEEAQINQASGGISHTVIQPLKVKDGGALTFNFFQYQDEDDKWQHEFMDKYSQLVEKRINLT